MLRTEEYAVNVGPQHPSTHGVFRAVLTLDGETVVDVVPKIGYLHRGVEKLAETKTYMQFIPLCNRMDYLSAMINSLGYVITLEKAAGIEVPERAQYLRVIGAELNRISSHLVAAGTFGLDLGAFTPFLYTFRDREAILSVLEKLTGQRLTYNYMRIGGVAHDAYDGFEEEVLKVVEQLRRGLKEYHDLVTGNEIFKMRTVGVGVLDAKTAIDWGVTGPNLRASGVKRDLRKDDPYAVYDRFEFEVPTLSNGDCFDRWMLRLLEIEQSLRIIEQAVKTMPEGEIQAKVPRNFKPPKGEFYGHIEGSKGELGFYIVSDGSPQPARIRVRPPSFYNIAVIPELARGTKLADFFAIFGSIDIVLGEVDR